MSCRAAPAQPVDVIGTDWGILAEQFLHVRGSPEAGGRAPAGWFMNVAAAVALPTTTLDEDAWDDLLSFIEERRVIPIVGPELLMVATEQGPRLLHDWIAERLAARLNVNTAELPQPYTLNDVVCLFL